jgi:hypothetical protein
MDTTCTNKQSQKFHVDFGKTKVKAYTPKSHYKLNKDHRHDADRRENYPNGYVEEWSSHNSTIYDNDIRSHKITKKYLPHPNIKNGEGKDFLTKNLVNPYIKNSQQYQRKNINRESRTHDVQNSLSSKNHKIISSENIKDISSNKIRCGFKESAVDATTRGEQSSHPQRIFDPTKLHLVVEEDFVFSEEISGSQSLINSSFVQNNFKPVSMILSIQQNQMLTKNNFYDISFNTGMLEGEGITINEMGNIITFKDDGSYRFEISGEAILFSDVDVNLVFFSEKFTDDIKSFSETKIPRDERKLQLRGIPTILPLQKDQNIIVRLIPVPDESIILSEGTRLLIHRVA